MTGTIQQFNYDVDIMAAALWQHSNAPNILALLQEKQDFNDTNQTDFWNDFYTNIFNIATANDFGLSVWAIILGAPILYNVDQGSNPSWGFGQYHQNFTNGNFAPTNGTIVNYPLSTESARIILQLRYYQLTGTCTPPAINRMLKSVFASYGPAHIIDGLDMTQRYIFGFDLPSDLQFAFNNFDVLPRPAGVGNTWVIFVEPPWGFNSDASNFNHSNFSDE